MTGRPRADGSTRTLFLLAHIAVVFAALAVAAAAFLLSRAPTPATSTTAGTRLARHPMPERAWGRAANYDGAMFVTLGPAADRRRKYEFSYRRVEFASAGLSVSNDGGRSFVRLDGQPMGLCGYHWQGYGVNAIVATRACVPTWAVDDAGEHAQEWLRIENLVPYARVVLVRYDALPTLRPPLPPGA